ncbi:Na(+)/H(+) antiporter subunit B [Varunaivibrio sulfuroxidans]|uniref:Multicomponent Na+:H+ antiporter subunit B n=1 Tax=Varunaivibrio sulfuroxidans TaxID=1773489 RepID=A0A4R3JHF9_9PROT|nr:Na(+)/H(+) antiporter subunit B [Varunaivibrio sulfuroxidans]TCS64696.1 multicomponent Na+:H+ antiporter subunit B [Varunaivibrio sulfuroxidans]WES29997.1 Na(+)/H(+) antiporter subunit B [Varunaivibrio sulfuroxidans]
MIKKFMALLVLAGLGVVFAGLLLGFSPDAQLNTTARYYADHTVADTGAANIVTAIIVTYRGLDTLGEVTVLFLTAAIVALILRRARRPGEAPPGNPLPSGELLQTGSRLLAPLIVLLGAYVFVNGHLTPGGGFQGGAIVASAVLLMLLSNPLRRFSHRLIGAVESISGLVYVTLGVLGLVFAGGFLDNRILPLGAFGTLFSAGAIPVIYTVIGLKVGAEFSSMMVSLSETEDR